MNDNRSSVSTKMFSVLVAGAIVSASFAGNLGVSVQPEGSVLKVKLDNRLNSKDAKVGDKFTATLDMGKKKEYFGLPAGTKVEGHVSSAQAHEGKTPGKIELDVDTLVLADGTRYPIEASTMKIDKRSVNTKDGRLMATKPYQTESSSYIVTGAAIGAGAAALTGGDLLAGGLLGAVVGFFISQSNHNTSAHDITLKPGTTFGVRFDRETTIPVE